MALPEHLGVLTDVPALPANRWTFRALPTFKLHLLGGLSERYSESLYRRRVGLKLLEGRVVGVINSFGHVTFKKLCQETNLDKSYCSRLVNRLSEAGLIDKEGSLVDQRSVVLSLTPLGLSKHRQVLAEAVSLNEQLMAVLTADQAETFVACLDLLTTKLRALADSHGDDTPPLGAEALGEEEGEAPAEGDRISIDADTARRLHGLLEAALGRK
jgi:DNA-binding MarR family transcriptional regulator